MADSQSSRIPSSGQPGLIEVPITLFQSGTNYFLKMASGFTTLLGDGSDFSIVQTVGANFDTIKSTTNIITRITLTYYFSSGNQAVGCRASSVIVAGVRNVGGNISPPLNSIPCQFIMPLEILYAPVNSDIFGLINWNGSGVLVLDAGKLLIEFLY